MNRLRSNFANFMLSKLNIARIKTTLGNVPIVNVFFKLFSASLIDYDFPAHLFIETTRACNLRCIYCSRNAGLPGGHMDFGSFTKIISEASQFGSRGFCLHMLGEPLLHPRIVEMVQYIKKTNPAHSILLTTNGYFLDASKAEKFLECNLDKITFSLFSLNDEKCKMLTGSANVHKVINNIRLIARIKKRMRGKTKIYIRFLISEENKDDLRQARALAKDIGVFLEERGTHNYAGVIENDYTSKSKIGKRHPCYHLWLSPAITWDGKIVACCSDWNYSTVMGDITKDSIADIWQGETIKHFRKCHLRGEYHKIPLCEKCNVWTLYPDIFLEFQKNAKPVG